MFVGRGRERQSKKVFFPWASRLICIPCGKRQCALQVLNVHHSHSPSCTTDQKIYWLRRDGGSEGRQRRSGPLATELQVSSISSDLRSGAQSRPPPGRSPALLAFRSGFRGCSKDEREEDERSGLKDETQDPRQSSRHFDYFDTFIISSL